MKTRQGVNPDEIVQPHLADFQHPTYFYTSATGDGVVFRAPCGGATTSGSKYPRSELREMTGRGGERAGWSTTEGTNTLEIVQAVTRVPSVKPHVVAGQIHDQDKDLLTCRLEGTKLFFSEQGRRGPLLTSHYKLGDRFTLRLIARHGGVECFYNGQYIYTYAVRASGCYFKAGCYTQSNLDRGDKPEAYGEVTIYKLLLNSPEGAD